MNFKRRFLFTTLILLAASQECCEDNTIKVSGNAEIKVKPDLAIISVKAQVTNRLTAEALSGVNRRISQVIDILSTNSIP